MTWVCFISVGGVRLVGVGPRAYLGQPRGVAPTINRNETHPMLFTVFCSDNANGHTRKIKADFCQNSKFVVVIRDIHNASLLKIDVSAAQRQQGYYTAMHFPYQLRGRGGEGKTGFSAETFGTVQCCPMC